MADDGCTEDVEYATQFFGFTPKSFTDGIFNAINDYTQECFKEMGRVLAEEFAENDKIASSKIRAACKSVVSKCYQKLDWMIDIMELYMLKNIFMIPNNMLLPEDQAHEEVKEVLGEQNDDQIEQTIDKEILQLKDKIRKEIIFKKMLREQREKLNNVLQHRKTLEKWFLYINKEITEKKVEEHIKLVCQNSLELKDIIQSQMQTNNME